ncbi:hypothetical protein PTW37_08715 [Arthrobacter agilis]|uniref:hypothetical protein n=1 Tax=Arthrobacter agilis TaxID=37921 RepID=UPI00236659E9|nr:hypothetical protein [Arthrobacter agilis]WDF31974.1 hypothetical protein PTW37_08715 [Arthrobacter agilis]
MPNLGIPEIAAQLGVTLAPGVELTKDSLLSAINIELRDLQVPQPSPMEHLRQVALIEARGKITGDDQTDTPLSTDLVPVSLVSQMMEAIQNSQPKESTSASSRPDPILSMRTNVKAVATRASADFTKSRSLPFAGFGALVVSIYGLRNNFDVDVLQLPTELFYPLFITSVTLIVLGYFTATLCQKLASLILRSLYNPDVQESALNSLGDDSSDYFGSHSQRVFDMKGRPEGSHRATDDGAGIIISRGLYRYALGKEAFGEAGPRARSLRLFISLLSTIDLSAATDDATGLALDRLCDLKIIEPIVYERRQAFRLIFEHPTH